MKDAKTILQECKDEVARKYGWRCYSDIDFYEMDERFSVSSGEFDEEVTLRFGQRIAELSWEAGRTYGEDWQMKESDQYRVITVPSKEEHLNILFPKQ